MNDSQIAVAPNSIPPELDRWNWGAFLLNWIWGIGNKTYIALLTLVPFVGFIMLFVLGAKGSQWAWRNRRWDGVEHFKRVQRTWAKWGLVVWVLSALALLYASLYGGVFYLLKHSEAYQLGVLKLQNSPMAAGVLGTPITASGPPSGSISVTGNSGAATLNFPATGPKGAGTIFLNATKKDGAWSITSLALQLNGQDIIIDLDSGFPLGTRTCRQYLLGFVVSCRWKSLQ